MAPRAAIVEPAIIALLLVFFFSGVAVGEGVTVAAASAVAMEDAEVLLDEIAVVEVLDALLVAAADVVEDETAASFACAKAMDVKTMFSALLGLWPLNVV